MTMNIDEKYDNAIQLLYTYYDGKSENVYIKRSVLKENGFGGSEFEDGICLRLRKDGVLKNNPFPFVVKEIESPERSINFVVDGEKLKAAYNKHEPTLRTPDQTAESGPITVRFDENQKTMHVGNKLINLSQAPIQRDLITIILKNPADAHNEWFYAEMDPTSSLLDEKNRVRLKNAAYQLRKKLRAEYDITDFFEKIDTRSCKISGRYQVSA